MFELTLDDDDNNAPNLSQFYHHTKYMHKSAPPTNDRLLVQGKETGQHKIATVKVEWKTVVDTFVQC
uniref:Uncharacterized protein n=1 Tax=Arion vulgaris TaxID=1028688 RepID=A0A0B6YER7_9EUPU